MFKIQDFIEKSLYGFVNSLILIDQKIEEMCKFKKRRDERLARWDNSITAETLFTIAKDNNTSNYKKICRLNKNATTHIDTTKLTQTFNAYTGHLKHIIKQSKNADASTLFKLWEQEKILRYKYYDESLKAITAADQSPQP